MHLRPWSAQERIGEYERAILRSLAGMEREENRGQEAPKNHKIPIEWAEKGVRKENYVLPALRRMEKKNGSTLTPGPARLLDP